MDSKNELSKVYSWYRTLEVYIKPEEDAKAAARQKKRYDRLEKTKNIKFDDEHFAPKPEPRTRFGFKIIVPKPE